MGWYRSFFKETRPLQSVILPDKMRPNVWITFLYTMTFNPSYPPPLKKKYQTHLDCSINEMNLMLIQMYRTGPRELN